MKLITITFDYKLALKIFFGVIITTVIGTLSHECGHFTAGKCYGYEMRINYASTILIKGDARLIDEFKTIQNKYVSEIQKDEKFPEINRYKEIIDRFQYEYNLFILGGPILTMTIGTFGFIFLFVFRTKYYNADRLSIYQWILIFTSLFWLRQTANMITGLFSYFTGLHINRINIDNSPIVSDEIKLALYYGLPIFTLQIITGIIGFLILIFVVFKYIPITQRFTFIVSGFLGGVAGYYVWLIKFGPFLMP